MAGEDTVVRLIAEQRKRLVAGLLGAAEQSPWWGRLSPTEQRAYREKLLASIGVFYDFCRDVIKVTGEDIGRNEEALALIQRVYDNQRSLARQLQVDDRA